MPNRNLVPSRRERWLRGVGHLSLAGMGVYGAFVQLPQSFLAATNPVLFLVWLLFMSTALVAVVAAVRGRYLLEYAALPFMAGGQVMYLAALVWVVVTGTNPGSGLALFVVAAVICYMGARWMSIDQILDRPLLHFRPDAWVKWRPGG